MEKMNTFVDLPRRRFLRINDRIKKFPKTRKTQDMASKKTIALKKLFSEVDTALLFNMNDQFMDVFILIRFIVCCFLVKAVKRKEYYDFKNKWDLKH